MLPGDHVWCANGLQADVKTSCPEAKPEAGEVQECLASNRPLLSWDCQEQLFRQEVENAEDLRLSVRLFRACLTDKKKVRHLEELKPLFDLFVSYVRGRQLYRTARLASLVHGSLMLDQSFRPHAQHASAFSALLLRRLASPDLLCCCAAVLRGCAAW